MERWEFIDLSSQVNAGTDDGASNSRIAVKVRIYADPLNQVGRRPACSETFTPHNGCRDTYLDPPRASRQHGLAAPLTWILNQARGAPKTSLPTDTHLDPPEAGSRDS